MTLAASSDGYFARISATIPATIGAANDVPVSCEYAPFGSPLGLATVRPTFAFPLNCAAGVVLNGAATATPRPIVAAGSLFRFWSIPVTATTPG